MNLFIDTTNWSLIYLLEKDNQIIASYEKREIKKISDIAVEELKLFLANQKLNIRDIKNIYVTTGPGSYTGVRIGLAVAKTLKALNNDYNVFVANSLMFQAGDQAAISLLDARGNKSYLGVYENSQPLISETVIENDQIPLLVQQYPNMKIIKDYEDISFSENYLKLKTKFKEIKNLADLNPVYIKSFI
ncbi:tRNA (adenosine(37)-N6)-threonylcarbamoyltransferase complex dimerization subunit type 1 TsaB [Mesoplasma seiffertii]|uniref:tRNA (adenosine(37)-N6)-threonylcarbamoyltransferase complex dimerization subunit type 1 TsaB n=1 Tax=Mesoplasma seiffertii TaxID=28224 RepID=UPI00047AA68B|nr:tRNA (adenosine(37)-N6)-threonylcarbamoyltransferase complex dimerization subunit type 1 TsaB [Mesoplasma seiffertii]